MLQVRTGQSATVVSVRCDACGRVHRAEEDSAKVFRGLTAGARARAKAKKDGWLVDGTRDLCVGCAGAAR